MRVNIIVEVANLTYFTAISYLRIRNFRSQLHCKPIEKFVEFY